MTISDIKSKTYAVSASDTVAALSLPSGTWRYVITKTTSDSSPVMISTDPDVAFADADGESGAVILPGVPEAYALPVGTDTLYLICASGESATVYVKPSSGE